MAEGFIGRRGELALLRKRLERVAAAGAGVAVALRGRRQVGKSRLIQEFCDRAEVPYVFFTAIKGASPVESVREFCTDLKDSALPADPELVPTLENGSWPDAFRVLAAALPDSTSVVVIDELPWLAEQDDLFDGALQTAWDRLLRAKPVLLVLLGSDLHMMERLTAYDRPFFGRADNMVLGPLDPAETAQAVGLEGADAIDAHLVSGGLPGVLRSWPHGTPALSFVEQECADPAAPLFSIPESSLMAEFPSPDQARRVLESVGSGDRTQANIASSAGGRQGTMASGALSPLLRRLVEEKRVLAVDEPLSVRPGKPALYHVADSNLRLYLAMLRAAQEQSRRGRPQAAFKLVQRRWTSWRGRAVEPLIRQALEMALADGSLPWPEAEKVGAWWNRRFDPEVDLIGADRAPVAGRIFFAGSIKWLGTPFDRHDLAALRAAAVQVPGFTSGLVVVSHSGVTADVDLSRTDVVWGPGDVVAAWS
ncbi:ATPase [Planomonospora sphaerica]|uniref:ATPase n=1 Tax=Planomonospora sphaerica TaxID=161355 RepID=A0A161LL11_9ACTN|nr:AAA family ATPase [Planomonospora sphaerica]GAT70094.1 ATPase [Planomonospora sphaerica]